MPAEPEAINIQEQVQRYLRVLGEKWYFIAVVTIIALLIGFSLAQLWPATYEASTLFVLRETNLISDSDLEKSLKKMKVGVKSKILAREIRSRSRIMEVMRKLEWKEYIRAQMSLQDEMKFIERVGDAIDVEITPDAVGETQVNFTFEWTDPQKAADFCNAMRDLWINKKLLNFQQESKDNLAQAEVILKQRNLDYIKAKEELDRFERENNFASLGIPEENYAQQSQIMADLTACTAKVEPLKAQITKLENDLAEMEPILELADKKTNPEYTKAYNLLQELKKNYLQKSQRLTDANPELQRIKEQVMGQQKLVDAMEDQKYLDEGIKTQPNPLYQEKMALLDSLKPVYAEALKQQKLCEENLDRVNDRINKYPPLRAEWDDLDAKVLHARAQLEKAQEEIQPLRDQVNSFRTLKQSGGTWEAETTFKDQTFEVLSSAAAKNEPKNPMTIIILSVSLFLGFGIGLVLSLVGELLKASFSTQEEVISYLRRPVLGAVSRIMTESEIKAIKWRKVVFASSSLLLIFSLVAIIYICNRYPQLIPPAIVDKVNEIRESLS